MENTVNGIHHITAIAGNARSNYDFYTKVLGLRLVKKTVNFDDPKTYHLYYGDKIGTPGTIMTFFPWENAPSGRTGSRQVTQIGYSVPENSFGFWQRYFDKQRIHYNPVSVRFGESYLSFSDPDGLPLELIASKSGDPRPAWETSHVSIENAIRGFHRIAITTNSLRATADVLTEIFGYQFAEQQNNEYRFITKAVENAAILDVLESPGQIAGRIGKGSVHHVALSVRNEEVLMHYRRKIIDFGLDVTDKIDRNYFFSIYFHEPGGVLFELATDNPGFAYDEPVERLGTHLQLPAKYEKHRNTIEAILPKIY